MQFTAWPRRVEEGTGRGLDLFNGQRGNGQTMLLEGVVQNSNGQNVPCQVEVRVEDQTSPLDFDGEKQYTVTVEEVA